MQRPGHLIVTLQAGHALSHVPTHVDCLLGACRPCNHLDGGPLDRTLRRWGSAFRATGVFHARSALGMVGEQHSGFDDVEENLGLSRTYRIEIGARHHTADTVAALRDLPQIENVAPQTLAFTENDIAPPSAPVHRLTRADAQLPHDVIHASEALALEPGDERVTVAVVDTGLALGHPEFQRKLLAGYDTVDLGIGSLGSGVMLVGDSLGRDFAARDETGHGSSVGGVLGAQGWRIPRGLAGLALLLPVRVLAAARVGPATAKPVGVGGLCDIDVGMKVAVDLGADVINMSFGTPQSGVDPAAPKPHARVVAYATHYECVLVAAAGNSGRDEPFYPAALPEVIAVGSADFAGQRSRFSTYGAHLTLCAPGERIVSAGRSGYQVNFGTSFAAPFVSGVAALLVSRARRAGRELNGADVKRLLIASARPLSGGFNPETGHGMLDAAAALRCLAAELGGDRPPGRRR